MENKKKLLVKTSVAQDVVGVDILAIEYWKGNFTI